MALRATVYKAELKLADLDRAYYADHSLTLALHPSETEQRLMLRLLAFALWAEADLSFGPGLSSEGEPDLVRTDLTGRLLWWAEVGLPDEKWLRKACGRAAQVQVLAYGGHRAELWWRQHQASLARFTNLSVCAISVDDANALATLAARAMRLECTVQEGAVWVAATHTAAHDALHIQPQWWLRAGAG